MEMEKEKEMERKTHTLHQLQSRLLVVLRVLVRAHSRIGLHVHQCPITRARRPVSRPVLAWIPRTHPLIHPSVRPSIHQRTPLASRAPRITYPFGNPMMKSLLGPSSKLATWNQLVCGPSLLGCDVPMA